MKKYKINVTVRDIERWVNKVNIKDQKDTCGSCAVAQALHRHKDLKETKMAITSVAFFNKKIATVPQFVTDNIRKMDEGQIVPPFKFTLEIN